MLAPMFCTILQVMQKSPTQFLARATFQKRKVAVTLFWNFGGKRFSDINMMFGQKGGSAIRTQNWLVSGKVAIIMQLWLLNYATMKIS